MSRVRKALAAAGSAGLAAAGVYLQANSGNLDVETLAGAAGAFLTGAIIAGAATYLAKANTPS